MRAGRVADLDAVQLGGCAGSARYTGQRRLMTRKMHDVFIVISEGRVANTLRGRSTPPTKTTRAKHTRKTTPTSPSWRFTNKPSRLVTFAAATADRAVRRVGQAGP